MAKTYRSARTNETRRNDWRKLATIRTERQEHEQEVREALLRHSYDLVLKVRV